MQRLTEQLVSWISEQVTEAKAHGVMMGMSGGIDSSVTSVLCKLSSPNNTLGLLMPCHSNQTDAHHAQAVAAKFQIPTRLISLDSAFDTFRCLLSSDGFDPATRKAADANLKPRLRMTALYYFANRLHYLVVGCSNKCELEVGYCTKYGDAGVDILPLGNLVKSEVRLLAQHLGIPQEIVDKPPSAGLWEGQTDEQEMGLTYDQLDLYCSSRPVDDKVRKKIEEIIAINAHKRVTPPIPPF